MNLLPFYEACRSKQRHELIIQHDHKDTKWLECVGYGHLEYKRGCFYLTCEHKTIYHVKNIVEVSVEGRKVIIEFKK